MISEFSYITTSSSAISSSGIPLPSSPNYMGSVKLFIGISLVIIGCCANNVALELMVKYVLVAAHISAIATNCALSASQRPPPPNHRPSLADWTDQDSGATITILQQAGIAALTLPYTLMVRGVDSLSSTHTAGRSPQAYHRIPQLQHRQHHLEASLSSRWASMWPLLAYLGS